MSGLYGVPEGPPERKHLGAKTRFRGLLDPTAWPLILGVCVVLLVIDRALVLTFWQVLPFVAVILAFAIIMSRIVLPQVDLSAWLERAFEGSISAGIVAGAVIFLLAKIFEVAAAWVRA